MSGIVESVGSDVAEFEPSDAIYDMVRLPGARGTFVGDMPMQVHEVSAKPPSLTHVEVAAVPMIGQTAFHTPDKEVCLNPGKRIPIHAAADGVGHMAVQSVADTGHTLSARRPHTTRPIFASLASMRS